MRVRLYITTLSFLMLLFSCHTKQEKLQYTKISINTPIYDFGEIPVNKAVNAIFKINNTGEYSLFISKIETGCGCTKSEWTKEKIKFGEQGEVKVSYNAKRNGYFQKNIFIFYNGKDSPQKIVIKGRVYIEK